MGVPVAFVTARRVGGPEDRDNWPKVMVGYVGVDRQIVSTIDRFE